MSQKPKKVKLNSDDLRAVAGFACVCASASLSIFEAAFPDDRRARDAIEIASAFAAGATRSKALRDAAWAGLRASSLAKELNNFSAYEAARAAVAAAGAAFLHPLFKATQVKHILGAAAHAARALEIDGGGEGRIGSEQIARFAKQASVAVIGVLRRYPPAPAGGGRVGELMRELDGLLRGR